MSKINIDDVCKFSQPIRLPQMCFQNLDFAEKNVPFDLYKHILSQKGILIISLGYDDETQETLEKIVSGLGTPHTHSAEEGAVWHVKQGGDTGKKALARSHHLSEFVLHTDCSYEKKIPNFFALQCIRHDRLGGVKIY